MADTLGTINARRALDKRAFLEFHYPSSNSDSDNTIVRIPFYENPKITETQTANYAEYNPINRVGSMYAYMGAKSRKIKVKSTFTLPHLAMHEMGIVRFLRVFTGQSDEAKKALFDGPNAKANNPEAQTGGSTLAIEVRDIYLKYLSEFDKKNHYTSVPKEVWIEAGLASDDGDLTSFERGLKQAQKEQDIKRFEVIDTLLFFVALLRTSVANNVENPLLGPPLIRLTFGTLYRSVPCICKSYNLGWEEMAGYDIETLTPRRLTIDLTLEEVRIGDFEKFDRLDIVKRDNIAGWESAIKAPYTTDPKEI
jgi:hypothetical protein